MPASQHSAPEPGPPVGPNVTVFVCTSCRRHDEAAGNFVQPGADLADRIRQGLAAAGAAGITVTAMECLAVCKRPCTIAVTATGAWTYVIGDLDMGVHVADIVGAVMAYQRSGNGIVPWAERPQCFRKGVVARIPPLGFVQPTESQS